jgi:hypothetical protein
MQYEAGVATPNDSSWAAWWRASCQIAKIVYMEICAYSTVASATQRRFKYHNKKAATPSQADHVAVAHPLPHMCTPAPHLMSKSTVVCQCYHYHTNRTCIYTPGAPLSLNASPAEPSVFIMPARLLPVAGKNVTPASSAAMMASLTRCGTCQVGAGAHRVLSSLAGIAVRDDTWCRNETSNALSAQALPCWTWLGTAIYTAWLAACDSILRVMHMRM